MTKRRTEITIETERLVVVHAHRTTRLFCAHCGQEVETVAGPADDAPEVEQPEEDSHQS